MVRRAQNVHIYFFRKNENGAYEYAILQRTDDTGIFQGASGGIRDAESPGQAALRVAAYEAGALEGTVLFALTSMGYAPSRYSAPMPKNGAATSWWFQFIFLQCK